MKSRFKELRENYDSTEELKKATLSKLLNIDRNKIDRLEEGSYKQLDLDTIKAYCDFFNCSADYLLGLSSAKTVNENIKMICDTTGLSEESIKNLKDMKLARPLQSALFNIPELNIIDFICKDIKELQDFERILTEYIKFKAMLDTSTVPLTPVIGQEIPPYKENNKLIIGKRKYISDSASKKNKQYNKLLLSNKSNNEPMFEMKLTSDILENYYKDKITKWASELAINLYEKIQRK